jgi:purine-binding chemotaxis protein CheW
MNISNRSTSSAGDMLEIIAFRLHGQEFCVRTTTIREIRGWSPATPIPHAPSDVIGVMNLRGTVIPVIDLANRLGMKSAEPNERSAIVVAEVHGMAMGLVVDRVSDILTIAANLLQPVPKISMSSGMRYAEGIIAQPDGMICFLDLEGMFEKTETTAMLAA